MRCLQEDPNLRELTASEPLTLEVSLRNDTKSWYYPGWRGSAHNRLTVQEEYAMQVSWFKDDHSKLFDCNLMPLHLLAWDYLLLLDPQAGCLCRVHFHLI